MTTDPRPPADRTSPAPAPVGPDPLRSSPTTASPTNAATGSRPVVEGTGS